MVDHLDRYRHAGENVFEWMKGDFGLGIYDVELERVLSSTFRMVAHGDHLVIF